MQPAAASFGLFCRDPRHTRQFPTETRRAPLHRSSSAASHFRFPPPPPPLSSEHACGLVQAQLPSPVTLSSFHTTDAEKGTAGRVELTVEIGQEFTGHGMTFMSASWPPQHGESDQAYRIPVICSEWVQTVQWPPEPGGGHESSQPIGIAVGTVATTLFQPGAFEPLGRICDPWVFAALIDISAGIHMVPLYCTSNGEIVRAVFQ